ncbi:MAG: BASS family bile acid:Na+ symporter [Glaciecola sp.]|jgi:BASS family bile acid:Na+ symporter|uniref:bile acid:sodium symporter family protein n=1 Tax=Congregibacter sp. TaxID=2744308 RepID=UPI0039E313ED
MGELYLEHEYWVAVFQLVMAMLGMGATLTLGQFRDVLMEPRAVTIGSAVQLVLVPLIAYLCIWGLGVAGGVAVGIALIAAIPGGTTSNIFTHFARGNTALSITITALTTMACLVTTPLILGLLIAQYVPDDFVMPRQRVMVEIALTLLLPLALGMLYLRLFPKTAVTFSNLCVRSSLLGIAAIVLGSSMSGRLDVEAFGFSNLLVIFVFILALVFASMLVCKLLGLSSVDATAIDMEVVVRNINLGVLIKASLFPAVPGQPDALGDFVLFSLLVYGGVQMLVAAAFIAWRRPKHA